MVLKRLFSFLLAGMVCFAIYWFPLPSAAADELRLQINGVTTNTAGLYQMDGYSMVNVWSLAFNAGAEIEWLPDYEFVVTGNGLRIQLTIGSLEARINDVIELLPLAPVQNKSKVFVPLRIVCEALGFTVNWDETKKLVSIHREELKDGFSPTEILHKSALAQQGANTCSFESTFSRDGLNSVLYEENKFSRFFGMAKSTGQIQQEPFQAYVKQSRGSDPDKLDLGNDGYYTSDGYFTKTKDRGWTYQETNQIPRLWNQNMEVFEDPLGIVERMHNINKAANFSDDRTIDENSYYVINAYFDDEEVWMKEILMSIIFLVNNQDDLEMILDNIMVNVYWDCRYTLLINKETLFCDMAYIDMSCAFPPHVIDIISEAARKSYIPMFGNSFGQGQIPISLRLYGDIKIFDIGSPFTPPDVS
jgi:hypothetical protein